MTIWTALPAAAVLVSIFYYAAATLAAIRFAKRTASPLPPLPKVPPRVAVLKPLHGSSNSLASNLVSFLEIAYPRVEFYFGVESYEDAAAEIPVALRQRYQYANITLVIGEEPNCSNRKIAKLVKMADRAEKAEVSKYNWPGPILPNTFTGPLTLGRFPLPGAFKLVELVVMSRGNPLSQVHRPLSCQPPAI